MNTPAAVTNHLTSSHTDEVRALIGTHGSTEAGVADLIMIGSHGRTGLIRPLPGSVARNALTHAPSSVLVARGARSRDPGILGCEAWGRATDQGGDHAVFLDHQTTGR